jgi:hypothetical protein
MPSHIKFIPLDSAKPTRSVWSADDFGGFRALVEQFVDEGDEAEASRYDTLELWHGDDDYVEAVTYDGEVIGTIDNPPLYDISTYETWDQMEAREAREEAEREDAWERRLEDARERRAAE